MRQMIRLVVRVVATLQHEQLLFQEVGVIIRLQGAWRTERLFRHAAEADGVHELFPERHASIGRHVAASEID